jgi:hypothetical protein
VRRFALLICLAACSPSREGASPQPGAAAVAPRPSGATSPGAAPPSAAAAPSVDATAIAAEQGATLPKVDPPAPPAHLPESDVGAPLDPDRDIFVTLPSGERVRVTALAGAEELEAVSPDGRFVAFVAAPDGLAAIFAVEIPRAGEAPRTPTQLTNRDVKRGPPGQAPPGFVPVPDRGPLLWLDARTVAWTAGGAEYRAVLP